MEAWRELYQAALYIEQAIQNDLPAEQINSLVEAYGRVKENLLEASSTASYPSKKKQALTPSPPAKPPPPPTNMDNVEANNAASSLPKMFSDMVSGVGKKLSKSNIGVYH